jgi:hypothetical protein
MKRGIIFWTIVIVSICFIISIGTFCPSIYYFVIGFGVFHIVNTYYPLDLDRSNGSSWESSDRK